MHFLCPSCILFFKRDLARALLRIWFVALVCLSFSQNLHHIMSYSQFCVTIQFKISKEFYKNSPQIPKKIFKKFFKKFPQNLKNFPNNSKKIMTHAYRSKSFSSLLVLKIDLFCLKIFKVLFQENNYRISSYSLCPWIVSAESKSVWLCG